MSESNPIKVAVVISAGAEWRAVRSFFKEVQLEHSPFGEWFTGEVRVDDQSERVVFCYGGWGKIAAAASAQYIIDQWRPKGLINLGTCGGFEGAIETGAIVLAEQTLVYDLIEQIGDQAAAIAHYTTHLDLSWLDEPYPQPVVRTRLVSADRDLLAQDLPQLMSKYGAVAGDWESGAIAWVAQRNQTRCLILRGVSDLVSANGGEAYEGNKHVWETGTALVMRQLMEALPAWVSKVIR